MLNRWVYGLFCMTVVSLLTVSTVNAQSVKIGYIDLEKIRQSYKGFKDAQAQFQKSVKESQDKVRMMEEEVTTLKQKYEARKMMLTEAKRQEDERLIMQKEQDMLQYIQSQQQELTQKEVVLTRPLQEKIFTVVQSIAKADNYTYVLDFNALIYVDPLKGSDLTDQVLEELQKEVK